MTAKILVADDSVTIQKVVKITLANDPYELEECTSEESLLSKIKEKSYDLILLDFNLSTKRDGYELAQAIKELSPKPFIMALLGTFDEVDEERIKEVGIVDKIVKPFESSKFIKKCRSLLKDISTDDSASDEDDNWILDNPDEIKVSTPEKSKVPDMNTEPQNALSDEVAGWGMELPDVIDIDPGEELLLPPIIEPVDAKKLDMASEEITFSTGDSSDDEFDESLLEEGSALMENIDEVENQNYEDSEVVYPEDEDLDFPDMDAVNVEGDEEENEPYSATEDNEMEKLIEEDLAPEEFWAIDESENERESTEVSSANPSVNDDKKEDTPTISALSEETNSKNKTLSDSPNLQNMEAEIREAMTPIVEELVKKYCEKTIQKVAWEVIPDLAENLIKKELQEISKSIE